MTLSLENLARIVSPLNEQMLKMREDILSAKDINDKAAAALDEIESRVDEYDTFIDMLMDEMTVDDRLNFKRLTGL